MFEFKPINHERFLALKEKADAGDPDAQLKVGCCYHVGIGIEESSDEAIRYYKLAAEQGVNFATKFLERLEKNRGVDGSFDAKSPVVDLTFKLSNQPVQPENDTCEETEEDLDEDLYLVGMDNQELCRQALDYFYGAGAEMSYKKAFKLFHMAGEKGNSHALAMMGMFYLKGYLGKKDYAKALHYFESALERYEVTRDFEGKSLALFGIGLLYRTGEGVE